VADLEASGHVLELSGAQHFRIPGRVLVRKRTPAEAQESLHPILQSRHRSSARCQLDLIEGDQGSEPIGELA
jgi:hypothetical protein